MPPGMFMDESEVSSRALEAHNSNIAKQREVTHHIRKQKRASSGVAQPTGEESGGSALAPATYAPPRGLKANAAADYDSDENGKPQVMGFGVWGLGFGVWGLG